MHFRMQVALSDSLVGSCCLTLTQYLHMNQEVVRLHLNGRNRIFIKWTPKIIHSALLCSLSQSLGCFLYLKAQWMERWGLPCSTNKAIILKSGNCKYLMTDSRLHVAEELLVKHFVSFWTEALWCHVIWWLQIQICLWPPLPAQFFLGSPWFNCSNCTLAQFNQLGPVAQSMVST